MRAAALIILTLCLALNACGPSATAGGFDSANPAARMYAIEQAARDGDQKAVRQIIEQLGSDDPAVRMLAISSLQRLTGQTYGYRQYDPAWQRQEAIARWVEAYNAGQIQPMMTPPRPPPLHAWPPPHPPPLPACLMAETTREPDLRLEMLSQPRFLAAARAMVQNFSQRLGFAESACGQISLAVDEALCNVINHGYERKPDGRIWINLWSLDGTEQPAMQVVIEDRARQVDPAIIKPRSLDEIRPGGLGVHIIREVMDEARYEKRDGGGMRLTMLKRGPSVAEAAAAANAEDDACPAGNTETKR